MPTHSETKILKYRPDQMFDLVADVDSYPLFLPWCSAARVNSRNMIGNNEVLEADLVISFCLLYTSPSPRDATLSRMPSSA